MGRLRWFLGLPFVILIGALAVPLYVLGRFVAFCAETFFLVRGDKDLTPHEVEGFALIRNVVDVINGRCPRCAAADAREVGKAARGE